MADLIYEVKDHLARITMNRPEHLNCFSEEMIRLWTAALEDIRDRDDIYAVLLSGNGKAFCAGGDVKAMAAGDGFFESHDDITSTALARKNSLWKGIQRIPLILEEIDKPVIAKIHGAAVGDGLDMALMCVMYGLHRIRRRCLKAISTPGSCPETEAHFSCPGWSDATKLWICSGLPGY
jgi:enoyl-CoA hydratase/carnithine racemase